MKYEEFKSLMYEWTGAVACQSSLQARNKHPNRQRILDYARGGKAEDIIGYLCLMLGEEGCVHELFSLFHDLVDCKDWPPVDAYYRGRIPVILEMYKYWALETKILQIKYDPKAYWVEDKHGNRADWH